MRVAALYDVHGNLRALEAVLAEPDVAAADLVVVGGDCVAGPQPRETLARLRGLGDRARFVRGNADRELSTPSRALVDSPVADAIRWVAEQFDPEELAFLEGLPLTATVDVDGLGPVLFCHATPRDDTEIFTRLTPDERMRELLRGVKERVVVCGHTHVQVDRAVGGIRIVNAGSVGLPYQGRHGAFWALLGPGVEHRHTEYDVDAAGKDYATCGPGGDGNWFTETLLAAPTAEHATETFERMARGDG